MEWKLGFPFIIYTKNIYNQFLLPTYKDTFIDLVWMNISENKMRLMYVACYVNSIVYMKSGQNLCCPLFGNQWIHDIIYCEKRTPCTLKIKNITPIWHPYLEETQAKKTTSQWQTYIQIYWMFAGTCTTIWSKMIRKIVSFPFKHFNI